MKKGKAVLVGLIFIFLILIAAAAYYYLNQSGRLAPEASTIQVITPTVAPSPTPTLTIEEELNSIDLEKDEASESSELNAIDAELKEL